MMRRIAFKLLQQSMLVSAEDDLGERVLRKYITNYIGACKVSIMRKKPVKENVASEKKLAGI